MTIFVLVAAIATAVALAAVLWPLLRRPRDATAAGSDAANLDILKSQLAELEADHARGTIGDTMYAEARAELERRALEDVAGEGGTTVIAAPPADAAAATSPAAPGSASRRHVHATAVALFVVVPLAAALIYAQLGTPGVLSGEFEAAGAPGGEPSADGAQPQITREQVEQMVAQLAERMKSEPGNAEGWAMLGRSYYMLQQYEDAVRAYAQLAKLMPQNPDALADYADALAMARGRKLAGEPIALVRQALTLNPKHMKSLAMAGSEAFERSDYNAAIDYWTRLRDELPSNVNVTQNIEASIADARSRAAAAGPASGGKPGAKSPEKAPGTSADAARSPGAEAKKGAEATSASIAGRVALSQELRQRVQPTDTVFVVARAAQGPRMPLAVLRLQVKDLPATFSLDDSMAMTPAMKLSGAGDVVVVARVSKAGTATPASGDLEGLSPAVKPGARDVVVTIDRVLP